MSSLAFQSRVPVFDANVRVGDRRDEAAIVRDRAGLLREMDRHEVNKALIYHAQGELLSPRDGNEMLTDWLGNDGRLQPQWLMMPTPESLAQLAALHAAGQVRSVRLYDARAAGLPFATWAYREMLGWLMEQRIPLWIPLPEMGADELVNTLSAFPDLVTVLVGAHYAHHLWIRPVLRTLPNAHLELSRYEPIGGVERLIGEFGAKRFVYGSWFGRYAMGPILFYLHHLAISEAELALLCAGNLERILTEAGHYD